MFQHNKQNVRFPRFLYDNKLYNSNLQNRINTKQYNHIKQIEYKVEDPHDINRILRDGWEMLTVAGPQPQ